MTCFEGLLRQKCRYNFISGSGSQVGCTIEMEKELVKENNMIRICAITRRSHNGNELSDDELSNDELFDRFHFILHSIIVVSLIFYFLLFILILPVLLV